MRTTKKYISNETCNAFLSAILLFSTKHVEDNVERKISAVPENKEIAGDIFGTHTVKGLVDTEDINKFTEKLEELCKKWDCDI